MKVKVSEIKIFHQKHISEKTFSLKQIAWKVIVLLLAIYQGRVSEQSGQSNCSICSIAYYYQYRLVPFCGNYVLRVYLSPMLKVCFSFIHVCKPRLNRLLNCNNFCNLG